MGQLIALLSSKDPAEVFIDMENSKPSERERKHWEVVDEVLRRGAGVLKLLEEYKGCQELARKAMSSPSAENERIAFEGLLAAVESIAAFFHFSKELEKTLTDLLTVLATPTSEEKKMSLTDQQALAKQLADILDLTLRFDQTRMQRPFLSNDFSYYRRLLPKFSKHPAVKVKDDEASGMALFTAEPTPMMNTLAKGAATALKQNDSTTAALCVMANSCLKMIKERKFERPETNLFCARAMTGAIILFDQVHPTGAFHRSPIAIKDAIKLLKERFPTEQALMNAIKYSTKNWKTAPSGIQSLLPN